MGGSGEWGGHCSHLHLPQITPSRAGGGFVSDDHSRHVISGLLPGGVEWLEESEDFQLVLSQETREGVVRVAEKRRESVNNVVRHTLEMVYAGKVPWP